MKRYLYNSRIIKTWQIFLILVALNELLLFRIASDHKVQIAITEMIELTERTPVITDRTFDQESIYRNAMIFLPVVLSIKYLLLGLFLQLAFVIQFKELRFKQSWRIALIASFAPFLAGLASFLNRLQTSGSEKSSDHIPLGLLNFIETEHLNHATLFLLNQFNLFELLWCLLIYAGLKYYQIDNVRNLKLLVPAAWLMLVCLQFVILLVARQMTGA